MGEATLTVTSQSSAKNDPTEWRDTTLTFEVLENSTKRGRVLVRAHTAPKPEHQLTRYQP